MKNTFAGCCGNGHPWINSVFLHSHNWAWVRSYLIVDQAQYPLHAGSCAGAAHIRAWE